MTSLRKRRARVKRILRVVCRLRLDCDREVQLRARMPAVGIRRVRVAPGKFVYIPAELAEKAARVFGTGLTRAQVLDLSASEPRLGTGRMAGSPRPPPRGRRGLRSVAISWGLSKR